MFVQFHRNSIETPNPENVESNMEELVINIESNCSESKSSLLHDQIISPDKKIYETAEYQLKNYRAAQALIFSIGPIDNPKASNPLKKRVVRANEVPYMTKSLRKAIATRSRLENRYYRHKTAESKWVYKKQTNYESKLYKIERRKYYTNLDIKKITDNKRFWSTMKPFFSDEGAGTKSNITLVEGNDILTEDKDVANTLNTFFGDAVKSLDISIPNEYITDSSNISDPIENIILKCANHSSIISINSSITKSTFSFSVVNVDDIKTELDALNCRKPCKSDSIPATFLKNYSSICREPLHNIIEMPLLIKMLSLQTLLLFIKKMILLTKVIIVPLVYCP